MRLFLYKPLVFPNTHLTQHTSLLESEDRAQSIARDASTGQFVGNAIGLLSNTGIPLNPLAVPLQLATSGLEMYQMHRGFQSVEKGLQTLQNTVGVLQSTTAVIGMGVAAGVALSAVNLHQILKLRQAVEKLDVKIENGFGDIFQEIILLPDKIKFEQHRTILIQAYGRFAGSMDRLRSAISIQDEAHRITELVSIRQTLSDARSDYRNTELLHEVSAPGRLRRLECAWAIEQAMISTYQIAGEQLAVSDRLTNLDRTIRTDAVAIINHCNSEEEFDFIAPEISRIRSHDLEALELWKNQNDWLISLPSHERDDLQNSKYLTSTNTHQYDLDRGEVAEPLESIEQRRLQQSTYPGSMKDRLLFMMDRELRCSAESYIHDRAIIAGYKNLNSSNLQHATEFAVANLYWYYKDREIVVGNSN